jgi:hypothetical protein
MDTWSFREQVLRIVHQWQLALLFIVIGGLLGFAGTYLFPSPYRAEADLYVGIDVQRVGEMGHVIPLAKTEPLNLDDYKNWQLKQVADIASSEAVLAETLGVLRDQEAGWEEETLSEFKNRLDIYWYDAGVWNLQVTHPESSTASRAAEVWRETAQDELEGLIARGEAAAELGTELEVLTDVLSDLKYEIARTEIFLSELKAWKGALDQADPAQPLDAENRLEWEAWVEEYIQVSEPYWAFPEDGLPEQDALPEGYRTWLETSQAAAQASLEIAREEQELLQPEREQILDAYHQAQDESLGLSANLNLEKTSRAPRVEIVRSPGTTTLIAGGMGLLGWLIVVFLRVRSREEG